MRSELALAAFGALAHFANAVPVPEADAGVGAGALAPDLDPRHRRPRTTKTTTTPTRTSSTSTIGPTPFVTTRPYCFLADWCVPDPREFPEMYPATVTDQSSYQTMFHTWYDSELNRFSTDMNTYIAYLASYWSSHSAAQATATTTPAKRAAMPAEPANTAAARRDAEPLPEPVAEAVAEPAVEALAKRAVTPANLEARWGPWWWWPPTPTSTSSTKTSHTPTLSPTPFVTTKPYCFLADWCAPDPAESPQLYPATVTDQSSYQAMFMSWYDAEMDRYLTDISSYWAYSSSFVASYWSSYSSVQATATNPAKRAAVPAQPVNTAAARRNAQPVAEPVWSLAKRDQSVNLEARWQWWQWWWPRTTTTSSSTRTTKTSHTPTLSPTAFVTTKPYCFLADWCAPDPAESPELYPATVTDQSSYQAMFMSWYDAEVDRYLTDVSSYWSYRTSFYESYWSSYSAHNPARRTLGVREVAATAAPQTRRCRRQEESAPAATATPETPSPTATVAPPTASPAATETPASEAESPVTEPETPAPETPVPETPEVPEPSVGTTHQKRRIAVVGAGASGSSAAFFLARAARVVEAQLGLPAGSLLEIVVFDKNDYIGGRTTTVPDPIFNQDLEVGAAVMVEANMNLRKAAGMFGLTMFKMARNDTRKMDIWDGKKIVYSHTGIKWWDALISGLRYGFSSPARQAAAVAKFAQRIGNAYLPSFVAQRGPVDSIEAFAAAIDLGSEYTGRSAYEWATSPGVGLSARWAGEMLDSTTRANFGTDVTDLHGLAAVAGSAVQDGVLMVGGGNWRIFAGMLEDSGATVHLSTVVTDVAAAPGGGYVVSSGAGGNDTFDEVFWGNPWHLSPVAKGLDFTTPIPPQEYVHLHVTFVGTMASSPNARYFKQNPRVLVAQTVSTTGERVRSKGGKGKGGDAPSFQTLMWHIQHAGYSIVQLFSRGPLSDAELADMFGDTPFWTHRKEWDAYPLMSPTDSFPPVQPRPGFHYLAAMEPWLSTMETQTLSAREAVARAVEGWWGLGMGVCAGASSWDLTCEPEPPAPHLLVPN